MLVEERSQRHAANANAANANAANANAAIDDDDANGFQHRRRSMYDSYVLERQRGGGGGHPAATAAGRRRGARRAASRRRQRRGGATSVLQDRRRLVDQSAVVVSSGRGTSPVWTSLSASCCLLPCVGKSRPSVCVSSLARYRNAMCRLSSLA